MPPIQVIALVAGAVAFTACLAALLFRRPRWTDDSVRAAVASAVAEALDKAETKRQATEPVALGNLVTGMFEKQVDAFGKTAGVLGDLLQCAGELMPHRWAVALGQRGGRKKAANEAARRAPPRRVDVFDQGCDACNDPLTKNSSAIAKHVLEQHDGRRRQAAEAAA